MSIKGKGTNKQYAFNDFSDLIKLKDSMPKPPQLVRKKFKVKQVDRTGSIRCNMTHVWNGNRQQGWIVLPRIVPISKIKTMFPNVKELMYSLDDEVYGDWFVVENVH